MPNLNYDLSSSYNLPHQSSAESIVSFRAHFIGDCYSTQYNFSVRETFCDLIKIIVAAFDATSLDAKVICYDSNCAAIIDNDELLIVIEDYNSTNLNIWKAYDRTVTVKGYGDHDILAAVGDYLTANITVNKYPTVSWEYLMCGDQQSQNIKIADAKPIHKEFYPWIGDAYAYFDRYLASDASILVLLGETGTAKTSFIRSFIWHSSMNTMFTYEEELLKSDSMFVSFIVNEDMHLLVVEDADLFLTSREHDGNRIMSKFLNVSEGLASIGRKKIIFTANITEPSRIDNALLRAGRCFDCQMFRRLSYTEACLAARVAGIAIPTKEQDYSLAELFSPKRETPIVSRGLGFR